MKKKSAKSILAAIRALLGPDEETITEPTALGCPWPNKIQLTREAHTLILSGGADISDPSRPQLHFDSFRIYKNHGRMRVGLYIGNSEMGFVEPVQSIDFDRGDTLDMRGLRISMDLTLEAT